LNWRSREASSRHNNGCAGGSREAERESRAGRVLVQVDDDEREIGTELIAKAASL
jgi:hypothetical protein